MTQAYTPDMTIRILMSLARMWIERTVIVDTFTL